MIWRDSTLRRGEKTNSVRDLGHHISLSYGCPVAARMSAFVPPNELCTASVSVQLGQLEVGQGLT